MVKLKNVFRFIFREARFPWERFDTDPRDPAPNSAQQQQNSQFTTVDDLGKVLPPERKSSTKFVADEVIPRPMLDASIHTTLKMSPDMAHQMGWKKIPGYLINPKHWARGHEGNYNDMDWNGTALRPLTSPAREFSRLFLSYHLRSDQIYDTEVWNRIFRAKLGDIEEE